ncbi:hypothetical protein V6S20_27275 [Klebsiella pneumoniae]
MATGVSAAMAVLIAPQPNVTASPNMDNERFSTVLEIMLLICHSCQITCLGKCLASELPGQNTLLYILVYTSKPNQSKQALCQFSYACFPGYFGLWPVVFSACRIK